MLEYIQRFNNQFLVTPETEKQLHSIIPQEEIPHEVKESMLSVALKGSHLVQCIQERKIQRKNQDIVGNNSLE